MAEPNRYKEVYAQPDYALKVGSRVLNFPDLNWPNITQVAETFLYGGVATAAIEEAILGTSSYLFPNAMLRRLWRGSIIAGFLYYYNVVVNQPYWVTVISLRTNSANIYPSNPVVGIVGNFISDFGVPALSYLMPPAHTISIQGYAARYFSVTIGQYGARVTSDSGEEHGDKYYVLRKLKLVNGEAVSGAYKEFYDLLEKLNLGTIVIYPYQAEGKNKLIVHIYDHRIKKAAAFHVPGNYGASATHPWLLQKYPDVADTDNARSALAPDVIRLITKKLWDHYQYKDRNEPESAHLVDETDLHGRIVPDNLWGTDSEAQGHTTYRAIAGDEPFSVSVTSENSDSAIHFSVQTGGGFDDADTSLSQIAFPGVANFAIHTLNILGFYYGYQLTHRFLSTARHFHSAYYYDFLPDNMRARQSERRYNTQCLICQEEHNASDSEVMPATCGHACHARCIINYFLHSISNGENLQPCPLCARRYDAQDIAQMLHGKWYLLWKWVLTGKELP